VDFEVGFASFGNLFVESGGITLIGTGLFVASAGWGWGESLWEAFVDLSASITSRGALGIPSVEGYEVSSFKAGWVASLSVKTSESDIDTSSVVGGRRPRIARAMLN